MPPSKQALVAELIGRLAGRARQSIRTSLDSADMEGLTPQQARTLGYIEANQSRGLYAKDITEVSGTRAASTSAMLKGLERDGWIARRPDPLDSRRKTVHVTAKGADIVHRFENQMWSGADMKLGALSEPELDELIRLLTKVDRQPSD